MIEGAVKAIGGWFAGNAEAVRVLEPATWSPGFWALIGALVALMLLALVRRRRGEPMRVRPPQILVTRGELVPDPGGKAHGGAGTLTMTVSNLSRYPVQVLEVGVKTGGERHFGVAEVSALVPAMGEVDVETRLAVGRLDDGVLDVIAYAAATRVKTYRHRAELVWEPWAKRFKVAPLEQRIVPARGLLSTQRDAVRLPEDLVPAHGIWAATPAPSAPERAARPSSSTRTRENTRTREVRPVATTHRVEPVRAAEPEERIESGGARIRGAADAAAPPRARIDDLHDLVLDEGITPLPARSVALEERDAPGARPSGERGATGAEAHRPAAADLFALLGDDDGAATPPRVGGLSREARPVERDGSVTPVRTPASTPAEVLALHELLVHDREIPTLHDTSPAPTTGADARAGRSTREGVGEDRASAREPAPREPAPREAAPREAPARTVARASDRPRDAQTGSSNGPPESERRPRANAPSERAPRPAVWDDDRLAPRRERTESPLEFPEEF